MIGGPNANSGNTARVVASSIPSSSNMRIVDRTSRTPNSTIVATAPASFPIT